MVLIHVFSDILHLSHSLLSDILPSRAFTRYAYVFHCQDCPLFIVHPIDGGMEKRNFLEILRLTSNYYVEKIKSFRSFGCFILSIYKRHVQKEELSELQTEDMTLLEP